MIDREVNYRQLKQGGLRFAADRVWRIDCRPTPNIPQPRWCQRCEYAHIADTEIWLEIYDFL
jgi:hypothetical protein